MHALKVISFMEKKWMALQWGFYTSLINHDHINMSNCLVSVLSSIGTVQFTVHIAPRQWYPSIKYKYLRVLLYTVIAF